MRRLLPFLVPFLVIAGLGAVVVGWMKSQGPPRGEPVELAVTAISLATPFVRVHGMAHYPIKIKQTTPGNLVYSERTHYLFPLFAAGDSDGRAIRILVRTERAPEELVSFEYMTVEGRVYRPSAEQIPWETEVILGQRTEYFFTDDMLVIEPWRIESDGEIWERPD